VTILQAIILGLVQGWASFCPYQVQRIWCWSPGFRVDRSGAYLRCCLAPGNFVCGGALFLERLVATYYQGLTDVRSVQGRLFWYLVAASVPGGIAGFLLEKKAETIFRAPVLIAIMLIVMGGLLYWADRKSAKTTGIDHISFGTSILIGISQALAIIPGVSRSGITMTPDCFWAYERRSS